MKKYKVIKDSQEKANSWFFSETEQCAGTVIKKLPTGDYTIEGCEDLFVIERKHSVSEIAKNIHEKRFERELERLESFKYPFIVCSFTMDDVMNFPKNSGIPQRYWKNLKVTNYEILRKLLLYMVKYKVKIIFAGSFSKSVASSLFKRVMEIHG